MPSAINTWTLANTPFSLMPSLVMVSTLLGNTDAAKVYGSVVSDSIQKIFQTLLVKFIRGEEPDLFNNEIDGVDAVRWTVYPDILEVTDDKVAIKPVGDALKEAKEMLTEAEITV